MSERPQLLSLTDAAAERALALMEHSDKPVVGLRVGVTSKGCNGMSYEVQYAHEHSMMEEVVEDKGVKIFVDPMAIMYVVGSTMDYVEDRFHSGFVFDNPNETSRCGCGESFSIG